MFKKLRTYQTLDELPIWNWWKVIQTNDLRHLIRVGSNDTLPVISSGFNIELAKLYRDFINQMDIIKTPIVNSKNRLISAVMELVLDISNNSKDVDKIAKASTMLRAIMITNNPTDNMVTGVGYVETPDQRRLQSLVLLGVRNYRSIRKSYNSGKKSGILDQKVNIETILNVSIDVKKCSVLEFMAYQKAAEERLRLTEKMTNG